MTNTQINEAPESDLDLAINLPELPRPRIKVSLAFVSMESPAGLKYQHSGDISDLTREYGVN